MKPSLRLFVALGLLGVALGGLALGVILASDHESQKALTATLGLLVGWSFLASGFVAWWRRPDNNFGPLLVATGLAWFIGALSDANASLPMTLGTALGSVAVAFFVQALLAFPEGRLHSRAERGLVALTWFVVLPLELIWLLFEDMDQMRGQCDCRNLLLVSDSDRTAEAIARVQNGLGFVIAVGVLVILVRRWRAATGPLRRALGPVFFSGAATATLFAAQLIAASAGADDLAQAINWGTIFALASVPLAFLVGLLRLRLGRAAVGPLVVELGTGGSVRDALRTTLGDPTLRLAYWLPESGTYVDLEGHPVTLPDEGVTPVEGEGGRIAALIHDPSLAEDPELLESASAAAALALENERLQAELRARLDELRASRTRLVEEQAEERRRLERNLHDGAQQRLVASALTIRLAASKLPNEPDRASELLERASDELAAGLEELRELARGIHPAILTDRGLAPALESLATRATVPTAVEVSLDEIRLPGPIEAAAFYVASEALTNVSKHAQATEAQIRVSRANGHVVVEVVDDGLGGADPARGSGLIGLVDRVEALDGTLEITSAAGSGTWLRAEFPCA
jgi:signal transduction histidine kinase